MNWLINAYANMSGLWKKAAAWLPLIAGAGSLLTGLGGLFNELGHVSNASGFICVLKNIQSDPNMALIVAGLTGMGIHTNHVDNAAKIEENKPQ